ncbi:uncharacterized protein J3D65DRAFT_145208 [Phyllosticta citribraziliensis]|uniref:Uncharacterized protein n=1 Tax=Phyllosticta citribraziliensis TaxID=989973 RepID=A0ABR1LBI2_9PEZI
MIGCVSREPSSAGVSWSFREVSRFQRGERGILEDVTILLNKSWFLENCRDENGCADEDERTMRQRPRVRGEAAGIYTYPSSAGGGDGTERLTRRAGPVGPGAVAAPPAADSTSQDHGSDNLANHQKYARCSSTPSRLRDTSAGEPKSARRPSTASSKSIARESPSPRILSHGRTLVAPCGCWIQGSEFKLCLQPPTSYR